MMVYIRMRILSTFKFLLFTEYLEAKYTVMYAVLSRCRMQVACTLETLSCCLYSGSIKKLRIRLSYHIILCLVEDRTMVWISICMHVMFSSM